MHVGLAMGRSLKVPIENMHYVVGYAIKVLPIS